MTAAAIWRSLGNDSMPSRLLSDCVKLLAAKFMEARESFEADHAGRIILITCTRRTPEEQFEAFKVGRHALADGSWAEDEDPETRTVTDLDGFTRRSKHNSSPAAAVDFAVVVHGKISWDPRQYAPMGATCKALGLVWGGDWARRKDYAHVEIPG